MPQTSAGRSERALLFILVGLVALSALLLLGQATHPQPVAVAGLRVDRLSALLALLVSGVGAVVYRFAMRAMDGEAGLPAFLRWLALSVGTAYLLMLASNLLLLLSAWLLTSLGLHRLLTFYAGRPAAQRAARKKFLISRLGDLALLAAIITIWLVWGTLDVYEFMARLAAGGPQGEAATTVALLVALAALTKSAQLPFHSWLPETLEAPTPVSALMHAGIINGGGVLLLRFAPLIAGSAPALLLLATVGTLTVILGTLSMWARPDVKGALAWSTVAQMGFMMLEFGLGAFSAAALHLLGHSCYKAWSFLCAAGLPAAGPAPAALSLRRNLAWMALGTALAVPALAVAARITGFNPWHTPGDLALTALLGLGLGQLWAAIARAPAASLRAVARRIGAATLLTLAASLAALGLYSGATAFLAPALGALPAPTGPLAVLAAALPLAGLGGLALLHAMLPALAAHPLGRALRVHASHGFYIGALAGRLADRIWVIFAPLSGGHARAERLAPEGGDHG